MLYRLNLYKGRKMHHHAYHVSRFCKCRLVLSNNARYTDRCA